MESIRNTLLFLSIINKLVKFLGTFKGIPTTVAKYVYILTILPKI
ncbi:hypothetical protein M104_1120 [Bacteroides fragilis str. 1007-1-F |uniref:Uncharacterized protein n=1 Tax=Bacteroides fragilis str. 1007-1-F \|nr:hypothetical protein M100_5064 [Bacteroides fragilis str. 1007-1-F \